MERCKAFLPANLLPLLMVLAKRIFAFISYQVAWFACVQGAGSGRESDGPLAVAALIALNLLMAADRRAVLLMALITGAIGLAVESALGFIGVFSFLLAPVWLVALWMAFGSVLPAFLGWLRGRYLAAAALGAVVAPLSYYSGVGLGAIKMPNPMFSLATIMVVWAAVMPLLLFITERLCRAPLATS